MIWRAPAKDWKNCSRLDPNSALGHYYLGRVRAKSKLYLAAEQSYRKALELNPKSEAVLLDLALVYELESKTEDAIQTYQRLLQVNAQNAWARRRLGELYVGQNKLDEALRQFETLQGSENDPRETRIKIGLISFEKGDFERAATEFNLVLAGDPDNDRARYYLGATYIEMRADDKALEAFERVSEKSELYVDSRVQAAYLYDRKEETQKAIELVQAVPRSVTIARKSMPF